MLIPKEHRRFFTKRDIPMFVPDGYDTSGRTPIDPELICRMFIAGKDFYDAVPAMAIVEESGLRALQKMQENGIIVDGEFAKVKKGCTSCQLKRIYSPAMQVCHHFQNVIMTLVDKGNARTLRSQLAAYVGDTEARFVMFARTPKGVREVNI